MALLKNYLPSSLLFQLEAPRDVLAALCFIASMISLCSAGLSLSIRNARRGVERKIELLGVMALRHIGAATAPHAQPSFAAPAPPIEVLAEPVVEAKAIPTDHLLPQPYQPAIHGGIACQQCGGEMLHGNVVKGNTAGGCAMALLTFTAGIFIFFIVPVLGWVLGPLLCICAFFIGRTREKVWRCRRCASIIPRG